VEIKRRFEVKMSENTSSYVFVNCGVTFNQEHFRPSKVIFNPPYTILYWEDNTKTIVKCGDKDEFNEEVGVAMAISKRICGERGKFMDLVENAYHQPKAKE
jgi:hypothetical protein